HISGHPTFATIGEYAKSLDSIVTDNQQLFDIFGSREVYISAHKTKPKDYDFLYIVDLEGVTKIDFLQTLIDQTFGFSGWLKNSHQFKNFKVSDMLDKETGEVLHYTLIGNQLVMSYSGMLIENAITTSENPTWVSNSKFKEITDRTSEAGLFKLYINANYFDDWMRCYQEPLDQMTLDISKTGRFLGANFDIGDEGFKMSGFMNINDSVNGYLKAMLANGTGKMNASDVITDDASLYVSIGFNDFLKFFTEFETLMKEDSAKYLAYQKNYHMIEKYLNINIKDHLISWIGEEVAYVVLPPHDSVVVKDYAMFIKTRNMDLCQEKLKYIQKKIKRRTPFRVKTKKYNEHDINALATKGLFSVLFGKLFDKFEKPYYTFIDDYVVFTNQENTLHKLIDDYETKKTLANNDDFKNIYNHFSKSNNVFTYVNTKSYLPLTRENLAPATFQSVQNNKRFYEAFDHIGFQLKGVENMF
ncbi:MAG: DUF3352 domain-containing protein, partial [Bacteroidetes bacterium]|nr:DUF3352 domain-containing protein [Bacteroidota bacterium]